MEVLESTKARVVGPRDGIAGFLGTIGVRFMIDGRPYQLQVGEAYEINNQKVHSVMNKGTQDRINFIFDYLPPGAIPGRASAPAARPAAS